MPDSDPPKVLSTQQVAEMLGWSVEYVRKGLGRHGIKSVRGWPEDQVRVLAERSRPAGN